MYLTTRKWAREKGTCGGWIRGGLILFKTNDSINYANEHSMIAQNNSNTHHFYGPRRVSGLLVSIAKVSCFFLKRYRFFLIG